MNMKWDGTNDLQVQNEKTLINGFGIIVAYINLLGQDIITWSTILKECFYLTII